MTWVHAFSRAWRRTPVTCICFEIWLVHCPDSVTSVVVLLRLNCKRLYRLLYPTANCHQCNDRTSLLHNSTTHTVLAPSLTSITNNHLGWPSLSRILPIVTLTEELTRPPCGRKGLLTDFPIALLFIKKVTYSRKGLWFLVGFSLLSPLP